MNYIHRWTRYASWLLIMELSVMNKNDHAFQVVKFYRYKTISLVYMYIYLIDFHTRVYPNYEGLV